MIAPRLCGSLISSRAVFPHGAQRDHTLVGVRRAHEIQLAAVALHDDDARGARLRGDMSERLVHVALGEVDLVDGPARAQRLDHGVAALDHFVLQFAFLYLSHKKTPYIAYLTLLYHNSYKTQSPNRLFYKNDGYTRKSVFTHLPKCR